MSQSADTLVNQALGFHRQGQLEQAAKHYESALEVQTNHAMALQLLGVIRYQQGQHAVAKTLITKSLKESPNDLMAIGNLANVHQALGEYEDAIALFTRVLSGNPKQPQILANRGNAYREAGKFKESIGDYVAALKLEPRMLDVVRNLGLSYADIGEFDEAKKALNHCAGQAPNAPEPLTALGSVYRKTGEHEAAKTVYEKALQLRPGVAGVHCDLGNTLKILGDIDGAREHHKQATALDPKLGRAWKGLSSVTTYKTYPGDVEDMLAAHEQTSDATAKMHIAYGLGKAHEDMARYDEAFGYYRTANQTCRAQSNISVEDDIRFLESMAATVTHEFMSAHKDAGHDDERPIFIVGMPRSGTSLAEQILASHSHVFGTGEPQTLRDKIKDIFPMDQGQDYTKPLAMAETEDFARIGAAYMVEIGALPDTSAARITDKLPMNFFNIGVIALALPQARIIHCRRNPMDTCLSIYKNYFDAEAHYYGCDLKELGQYYLAYQALMDHWETLLPGKIITVQYEDLVSDQEAETRRLLDACGLPFDDACLEPHKTRRAVTTISAPQVRQPVHTGSVGAWRKYETQLAPLRNTLSPILKSDDR